MAITLNERQWRELREGFARIAQLTGEIERVVQVLERELGEIERKAGQLLEDGEAAVD
jgi:hypothetical protein